MSGPDLIADYLRVLATRLPADIVEELADGLDCTRRRFLDQGLDQSAACAAAIAEFGRPEEIARAFIAQSPARHTARTLLATGPAVGACWAAVLLTGRAWTWPIPLPARLGAGLALLTVIGILVAAATGRRYRNGRVLAGVGCAGLAMLDLAMLVAVAMVASATTWPLLLAVTASSARLVFTARTMRPLISG